MCVYLMECTDPGGWWRGRVALMPENGPVVVKDIESLPSGLFPCFSLLPTDGTDDDDDVLTPR